MGKSHQKIHRKKLMVLQYMERCPTFIVIREMQIKAPLRFQFSLDKWQISKSLTRLWGSWTECKIAQKEIWQTLTKPHIHLSFNHKMSLLGIYPKDTSEKYETVYTTLFPVVCLIIAKCTKLTHPCNRKQRSSTKKEDEL